MSPVDVLHYCMEAHAELQRLLISEIMFHTMQKVRLASVDTGEVDNIMHAMLSRWKEKQRTEDVFQFWTASKTVC